MIKKLFKHISYLFLAIGIATSPAIGMDRPTMMGMEQPKKELCRECNIHSLITNNGTVLNTPTHQEKLFTSHDLNHPDCFECCLQNGAKPTTPFILYKEANPIYIIHLAAQKGSAKFINLCITYKHNIDLPAQPTGQTPLHLAAEEGHLSCVKLLLENNANVNATTTGHINLESLITNITPLHRAAEFEHSICIDLLIANGAHCNIADSEGFFPIHQLGSMREENFTQCLNSFMKHNKALINQPTSLYNESRKSYPGLTLFHLIAIHGHTSSLSKLKLYGADPTLTVSQGLRKGLSPFLIALLVGHEEFVTKYKELFPDYLKHFNINNENEVRYLHRALTSAIQDDSPVIINTIIEAYDNKPNIVINDIDTNDINGLSLLHAATTTGSEKVIESLLRHKDINLDINRFTALHYAVEAGKYKVIPLLCSKIKPNSPDENGLTPLAITAEYNDIKSTILLIAHGATITPEVFKIAEQSDNREIMFILKALDSTLSTSKVTGCDLSKITTTLEDLNQFPKARSYTKKVHDQINTEQFASAAQNNDLDTMILLLVSGAKIPQWSDNPSHPWNIAEQAEKEEAMLLLLCAANRETHLPQKTYFLEKSKTNFESYIQQYKSQKETSPKSIKGRVLLNSWNQDIKREIKPKAQSSRNPQPKTKKAPEPKTVGKSLQKLSLKEESQPAQTKTSPKISAKKPPTSPQAAQSAPQPKPAPPTFDTTITNLTFEEQEQACSFCPVRLHGLKSQHPSAKYLFHTRFLGNTQLSGCKQAKTHFNTSLNNVKLAVNQRRQINVSRKSHGDTFHQIPCQTLLKCLDNAMVFDSNKALNEFNAQYTNVILEHNQCAIVLPLQITPADFDLQRACDLFTKKEFVAGSHHGALVALVKQLPAGGCVCTHLCFHEEKTCAEEHRKYKEQMFKL